jgi:hypothetical protein
MNPTIRTTTSKAYVKLPLNYAQKEEKKKDREEMLFFQTNL